MTHVKFDQCSLGPSQQGLAPRVGHIPLSQDDASHQTRHHINEPSGEKFPRNISKIRKPPSPPSHVARQSHTDAIGTADILNPGPSMNKCRIESFFSENDHWEWRKCKYHPQTMAGYDSDYIIQWNQSGSDSNLMRSNEESYHTIYLSIYLSKYIYIHIYLSI